MSTGQQKAMYAGTLKSIRCHDESQLSTHLLICLLIVEHQHTQKAQTGERIAQHNWVQQVQSAEVQLTQAERCRQVPHKACGWQDVCNRRAALLNSEHLGTCGCTEKLRRAQGQKVLVNGVRAIHQCWPALMPFLAGQRYPMGGARPGFCKEIQAAGNSSERA